ncbi:uncharacterized protein [Pagrus major]|uniref:uncharacterized protein n=1 Tax=Pagrus major TaxID=143350 RepID=UPI003CC84299
MDLPSKNMYDTFKDDIWKELGSLDPDWFETLTAQTLNNEGNVSDQDELCANQEGNFKAPFDKSAAESQLFSTPKVFRHSRVVSPETEDEHSFTAEHEKETLPWTATQSPCLFGMLKEGFQGAKHGSIQHQNEDSFDLLRTPQKSPVSYAKHISESLGAQIHPDISWTSSLNTPPAIPSTLILTKPDESPCPLSASADKNVVFVRKLFPSLSNASRVGAVSPKNSDMPTVHKGVVSPVAGQNPESLGSPQSSLNQSEGVWRPKLPDAIEDGDICSTVASVLDGAEDVLSIFFPNSSSALRKVKTDRIKRKQIIPTKEHSCSSADVSTTNNPASNEQKTADQDSGRLLSPPPVKTGDMGNTQWSPLSLSDIPPCTVDSSCHDNGSATHVENSISTGQLRGDFDSGQLSRPHMKITDSGFTKKKRTFVYTVKTSKLQVEGIEKQSQKMDSSPGIPDSGQNVNVKQLVRAPGEAECCSISKNDMQKQGNLTEENLPPSVQAKVQDLDISQLSRDFAQDFSQMPDPVTLSKVAEDTPRNDFSPSACLSAMKRANQKAGQANLAHDCDDASNRRSVATTNQNNSINEGTISDSGFQSAVADIIHVTASSFVVPSSVNNGHSQQWTGFKTDIQRTTFTSTNKGSGKTHVDDILQEAETDADMPSTIEGRETLDPGRESELHMESTSNRLPSSPKGTVDNTNCIPLNGQLHGSLPKKTTVSLSSVHTSGFKTASNKGIQISSANLERAKHLFEETKGERILSDQHIKCAYDTEHELGMSHGSVKDATFNSNQPLSSNEKSVDSSCQLTASQKADVTELCTLLEEADSQFEFTQFKTAKLKLDNVTSPQKVDKELDPDFLTGIDFDDSFNSDLEKHLRVTAVHDKMTKVSDGETSTATSKSTGLSLSSEMKKENSSTEDASSSSKQISEGSKSVMSDENKNLYRAGHTETSKLENNNPLMLGVGFKTAGGNVLRVSKKCLSKARALFADLEENLMINEKSPDKQSSETDAKTQRKCKMDKHTGNVLPHKQDGGKITCSDTQVTGIRDEDATKSLNNSKVDTTKCQSGFQMANGKGISISAKSMQEADAFFKDCDMMDTSAGVSVKHKKSTEPLPGVSVSVSVSHKKNLQKFKNVQGMKANISKEPINEVEDVNAGPTAHHTDVVRHKVETHNFGLKSTLTLTSAASYHGNPSSTAKALSSLSYTTSKNIGSSVINELSASGGFCTARGEKVLVSADALKKAECLLNDIDTLPDTNKQRKQKEDALRTGHLVNQIQGSPPKNGGFQTASGKGFTISSAALKRAEMLLSECGEVDDKIGVKPTHSKMPVPGPTPRNRGFLAASGKPVAFSSEALQKAKALFSDINSSAETPAVSHTRNGDKKQDKDKHMEKIHSGFSTAGGAEVHVSQKNLLKAKNLLKEFDSSISATAMQDSDVFFKDCNSMDVKESMSVTHRKSILSLSGSGSEKKNLSLFKQDQVTTNEESGSGHTEIENVTVGRVVNHEKMLHSEIHDEGFKTMLESTSAAALNGNPPLISKHSPFCQKSKNISCSASNELSNISGFCTASGKKVSISDDAMTKARSVFNENSTFEDTNKPVKQKVDTLSQPNGGFQTASGKGVAVSSAALKKAKALLSECEGVEDKISVQPTCSKMTVPGPPPRSHGFLAASGKPVAFSSEALEKAKAFFGDISSSTEIPDVSHSRNSDKKQDKGEDKEKIHCGFSTAGGAKVHVSPGNLLKAKNLLKEFDGSILATAMQEADAFFADCDIMDSRDGISASGKNVSVSHDALTKAKSLFNENATFEKTNKWLKPKLETLPSQNGGFQTASGKGVAVSSAALKKAKTLFSECEGAQDKIDVKPTHSKTPVPGPPPRNHGFLAASGKPVAISSEALEKAKALFGDISSSAEIPSVSHTRNSEQKYAQNDKEENHCGFSTAGGAKVHVSQKNLLKAKNLLKDLADGECHDSSPRDTHKSIVKDVRTSNVPTAI